MSDVLPESFIKRSLTYHLHDCAEFAERNQAGIVANFGSSSSLEQLINCALLDLSELMRTGLRGAATERLLAHENLPFPERPNKMSLSEDGTMVARLGSTECWVLEPPLNLSTDMEALDIRLQNEPDCYPLYCQHSHAWFALTGSHLPELMAKICGVDLRSEAFPEGAVVQTSVARVSAIIIHHSLNGIPVFSILSDSSSAEYFWHALLDAMAEYQGRTVGLDAFN